MLENPDSGFFPLWPKEEGKWSIYRFIERCGRMGSTNALHMRAPGFKTRARPPMPWLSLMVSFYIFSNTLFTNKPPTLCYMIWCTRKSLNKQKYCVIQFHQKRFTEGNNDQVMHPRTFKNVSNFISMSLNSPCLAEDIYICATEWKSSSKSSWTTFVNGFLTVYFSRRFLCYFPSENLTCINEFPNTFHIHERHKPHRPSSLCLWFGNFLDNRTERLKAADYKSASDHQLFKIRSYSGEFVLYLIS